MGYTILPPSQAQVYLALSIFLLTYALIVSEKVNRAVIALFGAVLMIGLGIVELHAVFTQYMEWGTISLLIGMMILVGITNKTGVFQYIAIKAVKLVGGEPIRILLMLCTLTALASALLDNVTTVLLIVPITFSITRILGIRTVPFLIAEIMAANIGGTATLIGDPPNIMIGGANPHLTFNMFLYHLGPIVLLIFIVFLAIIYFMFGKTLHASEETKQKIMRINEKKYISDYPLMKKSMAVLALTIIGFSVHSLLHVEAAVVAIGGATLLMLIGVKEHEIEEVFRSVEWVTIFFFVGLFTLVGGLVQVGIIKGLAQGLLEWTSGDIPTAAILVIWVSGIASATIDNIPFVATMIPLIQDLGNGLGLAHDSAALSVLWWSLALGACLGGNGTVIGASANVIVAGMAAREGQGFSYMEFLKIGAPITILTLLLATGYIYLRYLVPLS